VNAELLVDPELVDIPPFVRVRVTPLGIPLNVSRIFVPLGTGVALFELCAGVRKADAKPSCIVNVAVLSGTVRFVKMVAVPLVVLPGRAPTATLPMPFPIELIMVPVVVVRM
jgi:hypothetical protein